MSYKVNIKHRNSILLSFTCPNNHEFSEVGYTDEPAPKCPECGEQAKRVFGAPALSSKMGCDPNSAQADRWARMHTQEAKRQSTED